MLAQRGNVRVVMQEARDAGGPGQNAVQGHIPKTGEVRRADDKPGGWVDRSRKADAQCTDPACRRPVLLQGARHRRDDPPDHMVPASGRLRRLPYNGADSTAIVGDGNAQLRPAQVDADECHQRQRGRGNGRSVPTARSAPMPSAIAAERKIRWYSSKMARLTFRA